MKSTDENNIQSTDDKKEHIVDNINSSPNIENVNKETVVYYAPDCPPEYTLFENSRHGIFNFIKMKIIDNNSIKEHIIYNVPHGQPVPTLYTPQY